MHDMPPLTLQDALVESVEQHVPEITAHGGMIPRGRTEIPKLGGTAVYEIPGAVAQGIFGPASRK